MVAVDAALGYCLVADGIGGAPEGSTASRLFACTAIDIIEASGPFSRETAMDTLQTIYKKANSAIYHRAVKSHGQPGMGCTAEAILFYDGGYALGHMGDSRTYRLRGYDLQQITRDHSIVRELLDKGLISRGEAAGHPLVHQITRAVGIEKHARLDVVTGSAVPGDLFLLCSDGLTDMVNDKAILDYLLPDTPLAEKAAGLIQEANQSGGRDNITVALARIC